MPSQPKQLLSHVRRWAAGGATSEALDGTSSSDHDLLERFVQTSDESAFGVLVRRHGGLVLGVCRRVLGNDSSAEDCVQATFLVLARKASSLRRGHSLTAWLYGTAYRVALRCRRTDLRRRRRETIGFHDAPPRTPGDPLDELSGRELLSVLEEEIQRLPERYRLPVVLCCLEGRSQEEAAEQLGCTSGAIKGRLERGRARLHARLCRRGLTLAATLAAVELSRAVGVAAVSTPLADATVAAGAAVAFGKPALSAGVSSLAASLVDEVVKAMFLRKLAIGLVLLLAAGVLAGGAGTIRYAALRAERREAKAKEVDKKPDKTPSTALDTPEGKKKPAKELSSLEKKAHEELAKLNGCRATLEGIPGWFDVLGLETATRERPAKALYDRGLAVLPILVESLSDATPTSVVESDTRGKRGKVWPMNELVARLICRIAERDFVIGKHPDEVHLFWGGDLAKKPELGAKFKKLVLDWYRKNRNKTQTQRKLADLEDGWFRNRLDAVEWLGQHKVAAAETPIIDYIKRSLLLAEKSPNTLVDSELAESARSLGQIGGGKSLPVVRKVCKHLVYWVDGPPGTGSGGIGYVGPDKLFMAYGAMIQLGAKAEAVKDLEAVYARHKEKMDPFPRQEYEKLLAAVKKR